MAIFGYLTDQCRDDARRHSVLPDVERVLATIESTQSLSQFDPFPPPYIVKKKLHGRQHRLIAEVRQVGEHTVAVLLAVMIRGGHDYEQEFSKDARAYGRKHFEGRTPTELLQRFIVDRTAVGLAPGKPLPSSAEYQLLYETFSHAGAAPKWSGAQDDALDRIVCETPTWVDQTQQQRIQGQLNRLAQPCLDALSGEPGLKFFPAKEKAGWGVWAYRHEGYVLLIQVVDGSNAELAQADAAGVAEELAAGGAEALLRASRRAYPAMVLADEQLWLDLERETVANMALSPEETEVLDSARRSDRPFPLFINGRAGSGKSTILQYLFADILFAYGTKFGLPASDGSLGIEAPGLPLYLTANGELLRVARQFVDRLLRSEVRFSGLDSSQEKLSGEALEGLLHHSFREFRPFLVSLVGATDAARFQASRHVDFPRFRRMWEERFGKDPKARRDHGPDVSWHVIRSYIKGMGSEDYLSPEDYQQLPENQLTVTPEMFSAVFGQVWTNWYQVVSSEGYWDDQDLARHILDNDLAPRSYSAVFCDEAQDFTRIELEVLLRLSLYSNRAVPADAVSRVPFAFAGDEFQTLNPTGFRWDAVKAAFVEKFIFELDPERRGEKSDLNYCELRFNYRSSAPIVRFANLVQALRSACFGIPELQPQRSWLREAAALPVQYFYGHDANFWNAFRTRAGSFVVIVPCNEGEEAQYVRDDPVLSQHIETTEDGLPRNVLSAGRAKGCEYPAVVVYGFGEAAESNLLDNVAAARGEAASDARRSLTLQYFINRVYVAVSRPKRRLIVVDSEQGAERLWQAARDEFARERLIGAIKRGAELWGPEVGGMSRGEAADVTSEDVPDRSENAAAFEAEGRARRDSYMMMQAAFAYRELEDVARWRECRARALEYDEKHFEAGVAYAEAGLLDDARPMLWHAERPGWLKLMELAGKHPDLLSHLELHWARAILGNRLTQSTVRDVLVRLRDRMRHDPAFAQASCSDPVWQGAIETLLSRVLRDDEESLSQPVAAGLLATLDEVASLGQVVPATLIADIAFAAEEFARAATLWESGGDRRSARYVDAKARSTPYPGSIEFLDRLGRSLEIVIAYDEQPAADLDDAQVKAVVSALVGIGRVPEALSLVNSFESGRGALVLALHALASGDKKTAAQGAAAALAHFVARGEWQQVTRFVQTGELESDDERWHDKDARSWLRSVAAQLRVSVVGALARSERLPDAPPSVEERITGFLRDVLRVKGGAWQGSLSYLEAGAAWERTGRLTDTLQFYEAAMAETLAGDELHQVRLRWLAVKGRQLEYLKARQQPDARAIRRVESEVQSKLKSWRIERSAISQLSAYPELTEGVGLAPAPLPARHESLPDLDPQAGSPADPSALPSATRPGPLAPLAEAAREAVKARPQMSGVAVATTAAASVVHHGKGDGTSHRRVTEPTTGQDAQVQFGDLRFELRRSKSVLLAIHIESMESVRVDWSLRSVTGTVDVSATNGKWTVGEWGLHIELPDDEGVAVRLLAEEQGLEFSVRR